jgi:hypothetical protein
MAVETRDPLRLRIMKALTDALREITTRTTDETGALIEVSMADKVFRGRIIYGDNDPLPMLSILEVPIPRDQAITSEENTGQNANWDLLVQGFLEDDADNPTDPAYVLLADVKKRLVVERKKVSDGGCLGFKQIRDMTIGAGAVRPPDETSAKTYFWLALTLGVVEDLADPYS